ncbi:MAG: TRAP transporter substrate-binding protein DctP [Dethiosulfovibrio peptidovorans]|nr:MAG: TRAP transporter substrate-binding protein DctP [Dethiosulfovibrio peptidovorans]
MKKSLHAIIIASMILCLSATAFAQYKAEYKMSVNPGAVTAWGMGAGYFADLVKERTNGRVNIKVYYSGQLFAGKQTAEFLLLRNGAIDFSLASTINWSPQVKELNLPGLPFFISAYGNKRYEAMDAIENGKAGKMMIKAMEKKGVTFLAWGENGFREMTNSVREVAKPEDMKDLKIRVVGSPIYIDTFKALGANPINMNWAEATTAFQQKVVDGQENPLVGICIPVKIWNYHTYLTNWHYVIDPLVLAANPKVWKGFSKEDQQIIRECALDSMKYEKAIARIGMDDGQSLAYLQSIGKAPEEVDPYALCEKNGMVITNLTQKNLKAFREATAGIRKDWTKKIGPELVAAAEEDMASVK